MQRRYRPPRALKGTVRAFGRERSKEGVEGREEGEMEGKGEVEERWIGEKDEKCVILVIENGRSTKRVSHRPEDVSTSFQEQYHGMKYRDTNSMSCFYVNIFLCCASTH
jgi:hypothetical protein